ncbi:MAG TPA: hypothetical protein VGH91_10655 [Gammaproteobacteria bacterium]
MKADLAKQGYVTEIDFTGASPYTIDAIGKIEKLRTLDNDVPHNAYVYGVYEIPLAETGGYNISLFPNGKLAVMHFCDICPGPTVLWYGSWKEKDGVISYEPEPQAPRAQLDIWRESFEEQFGKFGEFSLFVVANGKVIGDTILVPNVKLVPVPIGQYFVRKTRYVDWEKDLAEVQKAASQGN